MFECPACNRAFKKAGGLALHKHQTQCGIKSPATPGQENQPNSTPDLTPKGRLIRDLQKENQLLQTQNRDLQSAASTQSTVQEHSPTPTPLKRLEFPQEDEWAEDIQEKVPLVRLLHRKRPATFYGGAIYLEDNRMEKGVIKHKYHRCQCRG